MTIMEGAEEKDMGKLLQSIRRCSLELEGRIVRLPPQIACLLDPSTWGESIAGS